MQDAIVLFFVLPVLAAHLGVSLVRVFVSAARG